MFLGEGVEAANGSGSLAGQYPWWWWEERGAEDAGASRARVMFVSGGGRVKKGAARP